MNEYFIFFFSCKLSYVLCVFRLEFIFILTAKQLFKNYTLWLKCVLTEWKKNTHQQQTQNRLIILLHFCINNEQIIATKLLFPKVIDISSSLDTTYIIVWNDLQMIFFSFALFFLLSLRRQDVKELRNSR